MVANDPGSAPRVHDAAALEKRLQHEASVKRNPHPDFKLVETARPEWNQDESWRFTKTCDPTWEFGQGGNDKGDSLKKDHIEIDPYSEGRPAVYNYKLLISSITPRPIGLLSTISNDGVSANLAPFSFTNMINYDPPIFTIGFTGGVVKDSLGNLLDNGECVINIISEHYVEAANATSINAPYGVSEWDLAGLHKAPCTHVRPARVKEAVFAVECKLMETKEFESRSSPGKISGTLAILEGINFWAREDAINEEKNLIDPEVLRSVGRLGGITYSRVTEGFELLRPDYGELSASGKLEDVGK